MTANTLMRRMQMRKGGLTARGLLLRAGLAIAAIALGSNLIPVSRTVYAIDNSALYGSLGDIANTAPSQNDAAAMANVTNQTVNQSVVAAAATMTTPDLNVPTERTSEIYLSEKFHSDYMLYEFGFNNKYFFYSNVANGYITSEPVKIEIPGNIRYSLEKDGTIVQYTQNTNITAVGSYVLTLTVDEVNGLVTTHYVSYYRFRIMEPLISVDDNPSGGEGNEDGSAEVILAEIEGLEDLTPEERQALENAIMNGDYTGEELFNADGSVNETAIALMVQASLAAETGTTDDIYHTQGISAESGMDSVYDYTTGYYMHTLLSGQVFYSDIQNGGLTRQTVSLRTTDKIDFVVYKDGELYEEDTKVFTESGSYMIIPTVDDVLYMSSYETEKPVFCFRIIDRAVNDLSVFRAPEGFILDGVYINRNGETVNARSALILNDTTVLLREDGDYRIRIKSEAASMEIYYTLDRTRPVFTVVVEKNQANIYYSSSDVTKSIVYRGDNLYELNNQYIIYEIRDTGDYRYFAVDAAGNVSGRAFTVKYGLNVGGVVAILIVIAALVGLFVYIKYLNKHTRVR